MRTASSRDDVATATETFVVVDGSRYRVPPHGLRIGRAPDNDVVLPDANVSRQHLIVWTTPSGAFLRDLGSQNGTYVADRRVGIGPEALPTNTRIRLGRSELVIESRSVGGTRGGSGRKLGLAVSGLALVVVTLLALTGLIAYRSLTGGSAPAVGGPSTPATPAVPIAGTAAPAATAGISGAQASAAGSRDPGLARALGGAVQVLVRLESGQISTGSGTVITPRGHVLTNYHVIGDNASGQLRNASGEVIIAVPPSEGAPARPKFAARIVSADPGLDFALLRIVSPVGGGPLPADLGLSPVPIGNSDSVKIGDTITIVGYPGLGGQGVTVTRGIHSGIQTLRGMTGTYFKTDTEINPGNSGGTAINGAGELIGLPTAGVVDRSTSGRLGLIRPINLARPLIERASQDR